VTCGDACKGAICEWWRGSTFNGNDSTTWVSSTETNIYEFQPGETNLGIGPWGSDTLTIKPNATVEKLPIYSSAVGLTISNSLGLGRNSTVLESLVSQNRIGSRTWSLFWGWQGAIKEHQMQGSLVLGGYDAAKTMGANFTGDFLRQPSCPGSLVVYMSDIRLNWANGTKASLFDTSGAALRACINPGIPLLTLPKDALNNLVSMVGGKYLGPSGGIYFNAMSFEGDTA
jgi:hypothetical protein